MRQPKARSGKKCPKCDGPLKRNRGAVSKRWFFVCVDKGDACYREYEKERGN